MASDEFAGLRERVRTSFRDAAATQWPDSRLDDLIDSAQADWCFLTGELRGWQPGVTTESGVMPLPSDCVRPVGLTLSDGRSLPVAGWRMLARSFGDFRRRTGDFPVAVCFDFDGWGGYRLFPRVPAGQELGRLEYCRRPVAGRLEIREEAALAAHALWQMSLATGRDGRQWWDAFMAAASARGSHAVGRTGGRVTRGRFF